MVNLWILRFYCKYHSYTSYYSNMVNFPKSFNELTHTHASSHRIKTIHFICHVDQGVGNFYLPYADHLSSMIFDRSAKSMW